MFYLVFSLKKCCIINYNMLKFINIESVYHAMLVCKKKPMGKCHKTGKIQLCYEHLKDNFCERDLKVIHSIIIKL